MTTLSVVAILAVITAALITVKNYLYKAKAAVLSKDAQDLQSKADEVKGQITQLNAQLDKPVSDLTPTQVQDYWNKK